MAAGCTVRLKQDHSQTAANHLPRPAASSTVTLEEEESTRRDRVANNPSSGITATGYLRLGSADRSHHTGIRSMQFGARSRTVPLPERNMVRPSREIPGPAHSVHRERLRPPSAPGYGDFVARIEHREMQGKRRPDRLVPRGEEAQSHQHHGHHRAWSGAAVFAPAWWKAHVLPSSIRSSTELLPQAVRRTEDRTTEALCKRHGVTSHLESVRAFSPVQSRPL